MKKIRKNRIRQGFVLYPSIAIKWNIIGYTKTYILTIAFLFWFYDIEISNRIIYDQQH